MHSVSWHIGHTLRWTSASWVTIFGGLLALMGIALFLTGNDWTAIVVLTLSFLTDWWDGCVARYHQGDRPEMTREEETQLSLWAQLNFKGVTHLGRAIDPFVDKIRFIGLMWTVGERTLDPGIMTLITILAIGLTVVRPLKRWLRLDPAGANRWGKYKVYSEVFLMVFLVFGTRPLYGGTNPLADLPVTYLLINATSLMVLILACSSAWGHLQSGYTYWYTRSH